MSEEARRSASRAFRSRCDLWRGHRRLRFCSASRAALVGGRLGVALWPCWRSRSGICGASRPRRRWRSAALRVTHRALRVVVAVQPRWIGGALRGEPTAASRCWSTRRAACRCPRGDDARAARARRLLARWAEGAEAAGARRTRSMPGCARAELGRARRGARPARATRAASARRSRQLVTQEEGRELGAVAGGRRRREHGELDPEALARHGVRVHAVATARTTCATTRSPRSQADPVGFLRRTARVRVVVRSLGGARRDPSR